MSILRALLADSDCVIMDEPLRGLDEKTRINTIDYIEPVNKRKRDFIRDYLNKNRINFIQGLSPYTKKFNSNYWKSKFYNAYLSNSLDKFYIANKDRLTKKRTKT